MKTRCLGSAPIVVLGGASAGVRAFLSPGAGRPERYAGADRQSRHGASYALQKPNADSQYTVDHSSATTVIDAQGKLVLSLPHASPSAQIVTAIRQHLAPRVVK